MSIFKARVLSIADIRSKKSIDAVLDMNRKHRKPARGKGGGMRRYRTHALEALVATTAPHKKDELEL